jgi:hypothetical protein
MHIARFQPRLFPDHAVEEEYFAMLVSLHRILRINICKRW